MFFNKVIPRVASDCHQGGRFPGSIYITKCFTHYNLLSSLTQIEAQSFCNKNGGNLPSIHSSNEENAFSLSLSTSTSQQTWIGINDSSSITSSWFDGTPIDYFNFANNGTGCFVLDNLGKWSMISCSTSLSSIVCQYQLDPCIYLLIN